MANKSELPRLLMAIAAGDDSLTYSLLNSVPSLATAQLARSDEFFIAHCHAQIYEGDTALHAAAFAYASAIARRATAPDPLSSAP